MLQVQDLFFYFKRMSIFLLDFSHFSGERSPNSSAASTPRERYSTRYTWPSAYVFIDLNDKFLLIAYI